MTSAWVVAPLLLTLAACDPPQQAPGYPLAPEQRVGDPDDPYAATADPNAYGAASPIWQEGQAAGEVPGVAGGITAPPSANPPIVHDTPYQPEDDPRNAEPGGFDLSRARATDDPEDARREPFTIDTLYGLKSIGSPRWSPDGARALLTVTRYELARGQQNRDIYMARLVAPEGDADGTASVELRRMTRDEGSDDHPRWAPDGRSFLFTSSRGGTTQVWRMPADGGEAEVLTDVPTGVSDPEWTADGGRVVFTSKVFPEYGADFAASQAALDDIKESPVKAHIADDLLFRHWRAYKDGRRAHIFAYDLASERAVDLTPGDFDSPAFNTDGGGFALSPDGGELCFTSNRDPGSQRAWTTNKDLYVVPLAADAVHDAPLNLTAANSAYDGEPGYSPDGRYIAFRRQAVPAYESDRFRLALYDRVTGDLRVLTEGFDNWVLEFTWAPDSRSILFTAADKGRTPLFRVDVESGAITRLALPSVNSFDVGRDGRLAFSFSRVGEPVELFVAGPEGQDVQRVTGLNLDIATRHDIRPAEELWIEGAEGRTVHTFVVKPHGYRPGQRYPLILNVHGGPQSQWRDTLRGDWQVYAGAGYVVAFANPHGSTGYGQAYTDAIAGDWGGKVYQDLVAVSEHLAGASYVDPERMGAMGWSYGGYMMNWFLGHAETSRFKAIASMMGIFDLPSFYGATEELWFAEHDFGGPYTGADAPASYREFSPAAFTSAFRTPTLIITGERDYRVPYTQSLQLFTALRRQDVPARIIVFPNDGHWPSYAKSMPLYYAAHLDWFHTYLGGAPSPYDLQDLVRGRAFPRDEER